MPVAQVNGLNISYEMFGEGDRLAVITPGGRSSKDTPGIRILAQDIAAQAGIRVMIWDRPNCGESDLSFEGDSEFSLWSDALFVLLAQLETQSVELIGASGGARFSLHMAICHPELVSSLFLWWVTGGATGLSALIHYGYGELATSAAIGGMQAVSKLLALAEPLKRNPANCERLRHQSVEEFIATMQRWGHACLPIDNSPVPGLTEDKLKTITQPTTIVRNGLQDPYHLFETSQALGELLPHVSMVEQPWGEDEFIQRLVNSSAEQGFFSRAPLLAPAIVEHLVKASFSSPDWNVEKVEVDVYDR